LDKYEYRVRAEEINALIEKKEYAEAVKIADTIDWRRVKSVMMLCKISDLYKVNRRYEDSKEILLLAYDRHPGSRKIIYSLCELSIKLEEIVQAVEYYKEFVQVSPKDAGRYILQYKLYEAQDVSLEERIAVLEEYKKREFREKWAYELAYLYHRIGLATRCVEECNELILWFGEGNYVVKAMELKMLHQPLSPSQQEKYDRRFNRFAQRQPETTQGEVAQDENIKMTLPISIKNVEVSNAPTAKIPSKKVQSQVEMSEAASTVRIDKQSLSETAYNDDLDEEIADTESYETSTYDAEDVEEPVLTETEKQEETFEKGIDIENAEPVKPDDDLDIKIKPIDMGEYNTINLQQEIAKNLVKMLAEEDMEATDATKALPIDTILDSTDPELLKEITDDSIKNAIVAPLLQDTTELKPITEEDLLASLDEKPKTVDELKEEEEALKAQAMAAVQMAEMEQVAQNEEAVQLVSEDANRVATGVTAAINASVQNLESIVGHEVPQEEPIEESVIVAEAVQPVEPVTVAEAVQPVEPVTVAEAVQPVEPVTVAEAVQPVESVTVAEAVQPVESVTVAEAVQPVESVAVTEEAQPVNTSQPTEQIQPEGELIVKKQITGQLSFTDIMAEWEETKKASEEKHREEMRQRMLKQTGPMFADFDAAARASVSSDLNLITPTEDVFSATEALATEVEAALEADSKEAERKENVQTESHPLFEQVEDTFANTQQASVYNGVEEEPVQTRIFNTAEIRGIEEKLLSNLAKESVKIEPELVTPVIPMTAPIPEIPSMDVNAVPNTEEAAQTAWEPVVTETPIVETPSVPVTEQPSQPVSVEPAVVAEPTSSVPTQVSEPAPPMMKDKDTVIEMLQAVSTGTQPIPAAALVSQDTMNIVDLSEELGQTVQPKTPIGRSLTKEEKELFGAFVQTEKVEKQIARAIDTISMKPATGNVMISGANGTGTVNIAKILIKVVQVTQAGNFSGKVAKITGSLLDKKDIKATFDSLGNGALIVEKASDITEHVCIKIVDYVKNANEGRGLVLLFEDTRGNIDRLVEACPQLNEVFNVRIDVEALDNDGLVSYGKEYAKEQDYSIDDMGVLALYTRISDMQTNDHHVTIEEVKEIVDEAIANANKKSVGRLMDVILAKRYDADDMIVLREKDFIKDR